MEIIQFSDTNPKPQRGHENSKVTMDIYAKAKYNKPEELSTVVNSALKKPSKSESGAKTGQ